MRARSLVVVDVRRKDTAQMALVEDHQRKCVPAAFTGKVDLLAVGRVIRWPMLSHALDLNQLEILGY